MLYFFVAEVYMQKLQMDATLLAWQHTTYRSIMTNIHQYMFGLAWNESEDAYDA